VFCVSHRHDSSGGIRKQPRHYQIFIIIDPALHLRSTSIAAYVLDARNIRPYSTNFFRIYFVIAFELRRELLGFPLFIKLNFPRTCAINKNSSIKIHLVFIGALVLDITHSVLCDYVIKTIKLFGNDREDIFFTLFSMKIKNSENFCKYFTISSIETSTGLSVHYLLKVSLVRSA